MPANNSLAGMEISLASSIGKYLLRSSRQIVAISQKSKEKNLDKTGCNACNVKVFLCV